VAAAEDPARKPHPGALPVSGFLALGAPVKKEGCGSLFDIKLQKLAIVVLCRLKADQRSVSRSMLQS